MSVIKSILVCFFIGLAVNAYAMDVQRILGELVQECDRKTWKKISDPEKDVDEGELVAVKHHNFDWTYGKVTEKPGDNFMGMVRSDQITHIGVLPFILVVMFGN